MVQTQSRRQTIDEAPEKSYVVKATNDQPFPPGNVRVNGSVSGQINGAATITWRSRNRVSQEVVFYNDDSSQASESIYKITVLQAGQQVWQQSGVAGES